MITNNQILRMVESRKYTSLVKRLMVNGRCHSPAARLMLTDPAAVESAALGMALQRLCELTYWPHPDAANIAHRVARLQQRDGLFARPGDQADAHVRVAAAAVALRGLIAWMEQSNIGNAQNDRTSDHVAVIRRCIDRAWEGLARAWRDHCETTLAADEQSGADLSWAIALWQLGDCDDAGYRLPVARITQLLKSSDTTLLADDISRLALMLAA